LLVMTGKVKEMYVCVTLSLQLNSFHQQNHLYIQQTMKRRPFLTLSHALGVFQSFSLTVSERRFKIFHFHCNPGCGLSVVTFSQEQKSPTHWPLNISLFTPVLFCNTANHRHSLHVSRCYSTLTIAEAGLE